MADNFQQPPLAHHHSTNILHNFDELPIGNNNKFNISEFAEGHRQEQQISAANLTMQQKIQSKVVKIKLEGLEDLKVQLSSGDRLQDFNIQLFKILKQNNPACLQKALQCAERWIEKERYWGEKQIRQIIENGFINGKGATKKCAVDLTFKIFSLRAEQLERTIIEYGLKGKTPKIIGGYLSLLNQLLQQFGIKQLKYLKPYLSSTIQVMNSEKLPVVKTEGMNLIKSGLKWLGKDFIWPLISELKQNMKKELQNFWQSLDKSQVMRSNRQTTNSNAFQQKERSKSTKKKTQQAEKYSGQQKTFDIYQISDPVDVLQKFDERWTETVLQSQKWNAKTTLLQQIVSKLNVPKIANTEHRHLTQMIRRLLNDSNFNVVLAVLKVSSMLAKGLRRGFNYSAKVLFPYITPKFRDKKTQMIQQTFNTLNNFTYSLSIQQVGEDIKSALKDKTPGMKNNTLKWMLFAIEKCPTFNDKAIDFFKSSNINSIFENLLNDPSSDVRDSTAKFVMKVRATQGQDFFKNAEKNINNKDMLQKFNEGDQQQRPAKSKNKDLRDTSTKKNKSQSKGKSVKNENQQEQIVYKNSYSIKTTGKGSQTFDITEELTKNMKKLNDNNNWQNRKDSAEKLLKLFNYLQKQNPNVLIVSANLYDFLAILRSRISDPNKQLIKLFVSLVGQVFKFLSEKEAKIQAKSFIQELVQALSDKNQLNRKQIYKTFDSIWSSIGSDNMIHYIGQILSLESNSNSSSNQLGSSPKQYILEYLIWKQDFLKEVENIQSPQNLKHFKDYPRIILSGLCDKSKELRNICQKIFKILNDKIGVEVFKNFLNFKQQKHAFKSDLLTFLQKYDNNEQQYSSTTSKIITSKESSYSNKKNTNEPKLKNAREDSEDFQRSHKKGNNITSLSNSRSKDSNPAHFTKSTTMNQKTIVEGSQFFAPIEVLTADRISREEMSVKYRSGAAQHPISCQLQIQASLSKLVNYQQLYLKMFSQDYHKNIEAAQRIIKLCRDVSQTNSIRQINDLLIKWVVIKLYGGNVGALGVSQIICPVLSILQKKKVPWSEWDLELIIFVMREYLIGTYYEYNQNIDMIKNIFKLAIALSSGERLLKKILLQFKNDLTSTHKHLSIIRKQGLSFVKYYRRCLVNLCGYFVDYFSNDQFLAEASSIPQLKQDKQFVRLLSNKFHESVLKQFSFKLQQDTVQPPTEQSKHERSLSQTNNNNSNYSRVSSIDIFVPDTKNKEKNKKVTPQKSLSFIEAGFPPPSPSPVSKNRTLSNYSNTYSNKKLKNLKTFYKNIGFNQQQAHSYFIDLSKYSQPNSHNPLGSNLLKLYPFNQSTIHFFSTLFQPQNQTSQKITSQLSSNCNMIYGSLFNNLMKYMQGNVRQVQAPEKLSSFMHLVQQAIKCPNIFKHVDESILEKSIRYTIDQLVYEDENRAVIENKLRARGYNEFKGDIFVKAINGIMLRLLDNSYPLFLINSLLFNIMEVMLQLRNEDEIYQYTNQSINKNKKIGLLIRCFTRVTATYFNTSLHPKEKEGNQYYNIQEDPNCIKTHHIFKFFILSKQLIQIMQVADLVQFQTREQKVDKNHQPLANTEESVVLCLCKIMRGLNRKNLLVKNYQIVKRQKNWGKQQKVISDFILAITGVSISITNQPLHNITANNFQQASQSYPTFPQIDEQLKKIIQQLSKTKTFNQGIKNLKIYSQQSGMKFDFKSLFRKMNFQSSFIQKVSEQIEKISNMQNSSKSLNPDIQNKLERLKLKLEGISSEQPRNMNLKVSSFLQQTEKSIVTIQSGMQTSSMMKNFPQVKTPKNRHGSSIEQVQLQSTQNDLKRRIQQMKNKVNTSTISSSSMNKMR